MASAVQRGTIPLRAPSSKTSVGGARVDGMVASTTDDSDLIVQEYDLLPGEVLANVAAALRHTKSKPTGEVVCWNCKGLGHPKSICPSEKRERTYAACITILSGMVDKAPTPQSGAPRLTPRPGSRTVPSRGKGKRVSAFLMSDGTFVATDGDDAPVLDETSVDEAPISGADDAVECADADLEYANAVVTYADALSVECDDYDCGDSLHYRGFPELFDAVHHAPFTTATVAKPTYSDVLSRGLSPDRG